MYLKKLLIEIMMKVIIQRLEDLYYYFFGETFLNVDFSKEDKETYYEYRELLWNTIENMKKL